METESTQAEWLSPLEAAHALRVSTDTIGRWAARGRLRWIKTPLGRLIARTSVEQVLAAADRRAS